VNVRFEPTRPRIGLDSAESRPIRPWIGRIDRVNSDSQSSQSPLSWVDRLVTRTRLGAGRDGYDSAESSPTRPSLWTVDLRGRGMVEKGLEKRVRRILLKISAFLGNCLQYFEELFQKEQTRTRAHTLALSLTHTHTQRERERERERPLWPGLSDRAQAY